MRSSASKQSQDRQADAGRSHSPCRLSPEAAQFYAQVYPAARAGCCRELRRAGCTEEEAEETFMDTCEKVMRTVDPIGRHFDPAQMVNLMKIASRRRLIDERRHKSLLGEVAIDAVGPLCDACASGPDDVLEDRETVDIGREAISSLPWQERVIFRQRHQLGLSPREIQHSMPGLSPRAYRRAIQRANAHVLGSFEQIESGERCQAVSLVLLSLEVSGRATPELARLVAVHLNHCRACRQTRARMLRRPLPVRERSKVGGGQTADRSARSRAA